MNVTTLPRNIICSTKKLTKKKTIEHEDFFLNK